MRCRPGDLAVVVRSADPRNIGVFVTVLYPKDDWHWYVSVHGTAYSIQTGVRAGSGGRKVYALDEWLRPIRDHDAQNETLEWAGADGVRAAQ